MWTWTNWKIFCIIEKDVSVSQSCHFLPMLKNKHNPNKKLKLFSSGHRKINYKIYMEK